MKLFPRFSLKSLARSLFAIALIGTLLMSQAAPALAARTGGRMGGSSFSRSMPTRSYSRPAPRSTAPGYYPGGGFGFPFLLPFFGFGGVGSLFSILIFIAIANFIVSAFRRVSEGNGAGFGETFSSTPKVSIAKLQIGVLAEARHLQAELDQIALSANTNSPAGLTKLLQESTLALLRHPEYWAYADSELQESRLTEAEGKFNRLAIAERSKFQTETLSNVKGELSNANQEGGAIELSETSLPGEFILVTFIVATQGKLDMPSVQTAGDLRQSLNGLGSIGEEQMLALEVLWTPQATSDTLTSDDLIAAYPKLKVLG